MRIRRISSLTFTLTVLVSSAGAQTDPPDWHRYTVKGEQFSFVLPAQPSLDYRRVRADSRPERLEITLGTFADGVVYIIHVSENLTERRSLNSFIKERTSSGHQINRKTEREVTVDSIGGKNYSFEGIDGSVQFFSKNDRLYQFAAFGASQDDVRVTRFLSSISLVNKKDAFELPDNLPPQQLTADTTPSIKAPERIFTPQEVDKNFQPVMNVQPQYTEDARLNQIKGTVVLKCTLAANGQVTSISVVSGLPQGLTEMAIAAARKLKFIPAMKDGKYVSVSTRLVYRFDLF